MGIKILECCCKLREDEVLLKFLSKNPDIVKYHQECFNFYTNKWHLEFYLRAKTAESEPDLPCQLLRSSVFSGEKLTASFVEHL